MHSIKTENEEGLVKIDSWRWPEVDHLMTMGFEMGDDYMYTTKKPKITVYQKKEKDEKDKPHNFFFVEEKKRGKKRFKTFNDVIDYFDTYVQPELDKNM